jgi:hypothetical protein
MLGPQFISLAMHHEICDEQVHLQPQEDLTEHLWTLRGNAPANAAAPAGLNYLNLNYLNYCVNHFFVFRFVIINLDLFKFYVIEICGRPPKTAGSLGKAPQSHC